MSSTSVPFQQAHLVNDLDEACRRWSTVLGAGPFGLRRHQQARWFANPGTDVEADVSYAWGYLGDVQIQHIEQHDDKPSIHDGST